MCHHNSDTLLREVLLARILLFMMHCSLCFEGRAENFLRSFTGVIIRIILDRVKLNFIETYVVFFTSPQMNSLSRGISSLFSFSIFSMTLLASTALE